jgi:hypothetical protein
MRQPKKSNDAQRANQAISDNAQIRPSARINYAMERRREMLQLHADIASSNVCASTLVTQSRRTPQTVASRPLFRLVVKTPHAEDRLRRRRSIPDLWQTAPMSRNFDIALQNFSQYSHTGTSLRVLAHLHRRYITALSAGHASRVVIFPSQDI